MEYLCNLVMEAHKLIIGARTMQGLTAQGKSMAKHEAVPHFRETFYKCLYNLMVSTHQEKNPQCLFQGSFLCLLSSDYMIQVVIQLVEFEARDITDLPGETLLT